MLLEMFHIQVASNDPFSWTQKFNNYNNILFCYKGNDIVLQLKYDFIRILKLPYAVCLGWKILLTCFYINTTGFMDFYELTIMGSYICTAKQFMLLLFLLLLLHVCVYMCMYLVVCSHSIACVHSLLWNWNWLLCVWLLTVLEIFLHVVYM